MWAWGCLVLVVRLQDSIHVIRANSYRKIVTEILPYRGKSTANGVTAAIVDGQPPADLTAITAPDIVKSVLNVCWHRDPASRRPIEWCAQAISSQTTSLFAALVQCPWHDIPERWAPRGNGWRVIHNPDLKQSFSLNPSPLEHGGNALWCGFDRRTGSGG